VFEHNWDKTGGLGEEATIAAQEGRLTDKQREAAARIDKIRKKNG